MRTKLSKQRWRGGKECNIRTDNISEGFLPLCWKNAPKPFLALPSFPFLCLGCSQWKGGHLKRTAITAYLQIYQILIALARFCFWQLKGWLPPSWHEWPPRPWTDSPRGDPYPGQSLEPCSWNLNSWSDNCHWADWCLSSPRKHCPPWRQWWPASTLRCVLTLFVQSLGRTPGHSLYQTLSSIRIITGDWHSRSWGVAAGGWWSTAYTCRSRLLGFQQSDHTLGEHKRPQTLPEKSIRLNGRMAVREFTYFEKIKTANLADTNYYKLFVGSEYYPVIQTNQPFPNKSMKPFLHRKIREGVKKKSTFFRKKS